MNLIMFSSSPFKNISLATFIGLMLLAQYALHIHSVEHVTHGHAQDESCISFLFADNLSGTINTFLSDDLKLFFNPVFPSYQVFLQSLKFTHFVSRAPPLKIVSK